MKIHDTLGTRLRPYLLLLAVAAGVVLWFLGLLPAWQPVAAAGLALLVSLALAVYTQRGHRPEVDCFHVFCFVGVACLFVQWSAVLGIVYLLFIPSRLPSFSPRTFVACLLGAAFPVLIAGNVCLVTDRVPLAMQWVQAWEWTGFQWTQALIAFWTLLAITVLVTSRKIKQSSRY